MTIKNNINTNFIKINPTIKVKERNNYGNTLYYVVDYDQNEAIGALTKQETLTHRQCNALVELGFNVEVENHQPFRK